MNLNDNIQTGRQGENIAKEYVKKCGMNIIDCNWHYSKNAEIDIIAEENDTIVFIEVKTRKSLNYGHPFESITQDKINKIHKAMLAYIQLCEKKYKTMRFDGIAIIGLSNPVIEHIKNIGQY